MLEDAVQVPPLPVLVIRGATTCYNYGESCTAWCDPDLSMKVLVDKGSLKLQALVYDILPSTTAVFSYVIGSRKLSANEHFFFLLVLKQ